MVSIAVIGRDARVARCKLTWQWVASARRHRGDFPTCWATLLNCGRQQGKIAVKSTKRPRSRRQVFMKGGETETETVHWA